MSVQFEEEKIGYRHQSQSTKRLGAVTKIFLKTGLAKTEKGAHIIMVFLSILAILGIIYNVILGNFFDFSSEPTQRTRPASENRI